MKALLALTFLVASLPSFADPSYKIAGRGIQNEDSHEIILLACVGESVLNNELDCNTLRLLQIKTDKNPTWLGNSFHVSDLPQVREELSKWYSEKSLDGLFGFLTGDNTYAFTETSGWNWANNPLVLAGIKFDKVVKTVLYFAEYHHSLENEKQRVLSEKESSAANDGIRGYRGVFLARVKEKHSHRSIIYSATDTDIVISLFSRGVVQELKSLPISTSESTITLKGTKDKYSFNILKGLVGATADAYDWCFTENDGINMAPALIGAYAFFFGAVATIPLCAILPVVPTIAGGLLTPIDAVITVGNKEFSRNEIAKRKFSKLMREKDIKANRHVFESMIAQIKAL